VTKLVSVSSVPQGVPSLPSCRVQLVWMDAAKAAVVAAAEVTRPPPAELAHRDAMGLYSAEHPFWATVADARLMTAPESDRRVRVRTLLLAFLQHNFLGLISRSCSCRWAPLCSFQGPQPHHPCCPCLAPGARVQSLSPGLGKCEPKPPSEPSLSSCLEGTRDDGALGFRV
jgi:hypothetical protein